MWFKNNRLTQESEMESKSCLMLKWFKHCFALLLKGDAMTGWRLLCTYTPACQPRHNKTLQRSLLLLSLSPCIFFFERTPPDQCWLFDCGDLLLSSLKLQKSLKAVQVQIARVGEAQSWTVMEVASRLQGSVSLPAFSSLRRSFNIAASWHPLLLLGLYPSIRDTTALTLTTNGERPPRPPDLKKE